MSRFTNSKRVPCDSFNNICNSLRATDNLVAKYLDCATGTIRQWRVKGTIPADVLPEMQLWLEAARPLFNFEMKHNIRDRDANYHEQLTEREAPAHAPLAPLPPLSGHTTPVDQRVPGQPYMINGRLVGRPRTP